LIKVIDRLFLKGFIAPVLLAFFIVEFVLIMQTLWKTIDDIMGNGYKLIDFAQLIIDFSIVLIPLALPLTILLSSVMVFGGMSERFEILSMKSAGISFLRMIMPAFLVATLIASFSLFGSNYLKPAANERYVKKMRMMKTNKLTFVFDEKVFNQEFANYSIYIDHKDEDGRTVHGIHIGDYTDADKSIISTIYAKKGVMFVSNDEKYLVMQLDSGFQFQEIRSESADTRYSSYGVKARPVNRVEFASLEKVFDLSKLLDLNLTSVAYQEYDFLNSMELAERIDTLRTSIKENVEKVAKPFTIMVPIETDTTMLSVADQAEKANLLRGKRVNEASIRSEAIGVKVHFDRVGQPGVDRLVDLIEFDKAKDVFNAMKANANAISDQIFNQRNENNRITAEIAKFQLRLHQQFSWATVCLVFLFIGAPAGIIVRKGGFGAPMLIATGFYLAFIMLYIAGERLLRSGSMNAVQAAWFPTVTLLPFALLLSWRAFNDFKLSSVGATISSVLKSVKQPKKVTTS
jgi:lipopolysaccharide export system permease protein